MGGHKFGVDQDEILIINVIKRIGWFWGGRAKRVHPKITNSFDNINYHNCFYLHPLPLKEDCSSYSYPFYKSSSKVNQDGQHANQVMETTKMPKLEISQNSSQATWGNMLIESVLIHKYKLKKIEFINIQSLDE
ncbi:hypothetical protein M0813_28975 [Anaeramoeba flamelloides]|uniref:Uncharacterized protein n=1 Tax=Anaeramoeba flamelloides TaxID=1746091 RepID=A0ABQ8XQU7_9EUKA|nr:hypothetical protein M0813_28975 [Anaeramoeba flamelloides]